jgi:hypothetical protein
MTLRNRTEIDYKRFTMSAKYDYIKARSVQGLDRYQESILDDFVLSDSRHRIDLGLGYNFYRRLRVGPALMVDVLKGSAKGQEDGLHEVYPYLKLETRF